MDYSNKGILIMLQDLQREYYGKVSIYIDTINHDKEVIIACCVFDATGEPHTINFYSFEDVCVHKKNFLKVKDIIDNTLKCKET